MMQEVEKTQDPKLFIVEIRWTFKSAKSMGDAGLRRVSDSMKFSKNKIDMINAAVGFSAHADNSVSQNKVEYYFSFLKYHDRWSAGNLESDDILLRNLESECKGFLLTKDSFEIEKESEAEYTDDVKALDTYTEDVLYDLLDYCDSQEA